MTARERVAEFLRQWAMAAHQTDFIYGVSFDRDRPGLVELLASDLSDLLAELAAAENDLQTLRADLRQAQGQLEDAREACRMARVQRNKAREELDALKAQGEDDAQVRALLSISEEMRTANMIAVYGAYPGPGAWSPSAYRAVAKRLGMDTSGVSDD